MFTPILSNERLAELQVAFDKACMELGIGANDRDRREHLAQLMLSLADSGERDTDVIRAHAVHRLRPPVARSFH